VNLYSLLVYIEHNEDELFNSISFVWRNSCIANELSYLKVKFPVLAEFVTHTQCACILTTFLHSKSLIPVSVLRLVLLLTHHFRKLVRIRNETCYHRSEDRIMDLIDVLCRLVHSFAVR
jgi:hypothetical protein